MEHGEPDFVGMKKEGKVEGFTGEGPRDTPHSSSLGPIWIRQGDEMVAFHGSTAPTSFALRGIMLTLTLGKLMCTETES